MSVGCSISLRHTKLYVAIKLWPLKASIQSLKALIILIVFGPGDADTSKDGCTVL